jgi:membrane-associated protease RseP (regulator of RpoE activity)
MLYVLGVLAVALGVALSIALHEIGHLVPAKRFGVKCTQYMIGFGPTLWAKKIGETEYGIKAIPLGGYVRMLGMFPPKPGRAARMDSTGRWSMLVDQARHEAQSEIGPQDADRLFYQRSVPRRIVIMLGGPTMNLLIAVVLLTGLMTIYGQATSTTTIQTASQCVLPVTAPTNAACSSSDVRAPAAAAGIRPGDRIVEFAGRPVTSWQQVRDVIRSHGGTEVPVVVERAGQKVHLTITPILDKRRVFDANGQAVVGSDGQPVLEQMGFAGLSPALEQRRQPISAVPAVIGQGLAQTAGVILRIPQKMVGVAQAAFGSGPRDPNGPVSVIGIGRMAGEVTSVQNGAGGQATIADKVAFLVSLVASLNLALFVFNLVPLLPLDGGHVAGALWEGLRRSVAKLLRRPDPGPVDVARALPVAYAVASVLIGMTGLLMLADLVNPIKMTG